MCNFTILINENTILTTCPIETVCVTIITYTNSYNRTQEFMRDNPTQEFICNDVEVLCELINMAFNYYKWIVTILEQ